MGGKYGYSIIESSGCVNLVLLFMTNVCPFIFTVIVYGPPYYPYYSVYDMMILILAYKTFKTRYIYKYIYIYIYIYIYSIYKNTILFMAYR